MDFKQHYRMTAACCLSISLGCIAPAQVSAEKGNSITYMEEVVVTAQKREEKLQDVAISVTAFTGENIEKLGLRQSTDIASQTPNYTVGYPNGENGVPSLFVRGVGLNDFGVTNSGPIAAYVDEVYISSNAAQVFQIMDVPCMVEMPLVALLILWLESRETKRKHLRG
jgi:iron complex outermembrane receptor protein